MNHKFISLGLSTLQPLLLPSAYVERTANHVAAEDLDRLWRLPAKHVAAEQALSGVSNASRQAVLNPGSAAIVGPLPAKYSRATQSLLEEKRRASPEGAPFAVWQPSEAALGMVPPAAQRRLVQGVLCPADYTKTLADGAPSVFQALRWLSQAPATRFYVYLPSGLAVATKGRIEFVP